MVSSGDEVETHIKDQMGQKEQHEDIVCKEWHLLLLIFDRIEGEHGIIIKRSFPTHVLEKEW